MILLWSFKYISHLLCSKTFSDSLHFIQIKSYTSLSFHDRVLLLYFLSYFFSPYAALIFVLLILILLDVSRIFQALTLRLVVVSSAWNSLSSNTCLANFLTAFMSMFKSCLVSEAFSVYSPTPSTPVLAYTTLLDLLVPPNILYMLKFISPC